MRIEKIIGAILLIPPLIGVVLFLLDLFLSESGPIPSFEYLSPGWTGIFPTSILSEPEGNNTPAVPIYLGLMAIAGAILIKSGEIKESTNKSSDSFISQFRKKKILAREFLLLLGCIVLIGLSISAILLYNKQLESELAELKNKKSRVEQKRNDIEKKIEEQKGLSKRIHEELIRHEEENIPESYRIFIEALNDEKNLKRLYQGLKEDQRIKADIPQTFNSFKNHFHKFSEEDSLKVVELKKEKSQLASQVHRIKQDIRELKARHLTEKDQYLIILSIGFSLFFLVFPLRFLILAIVWSIRTLKTPSWVE